MSTGGSVHLDFLIRVYVRATVRWDYQPDTCKDYEETGFGSDNLLTSTQFIQFSLLFYYFFPTTSSGGSWSEKTTAKDLLLSLVNLGFFNSAAQYPILGISSWRRTEDCSCCLSLYRRAFCTTYDLRYVFQNVFQCLRSLLSLRLHTDRNGTFERPIQSEKVRKMRFPKFRSFIGNEGMLWRIELSQSMPIASPNWWIVGSRWSLSYVSCNNSCSSAEDDSGDNSCSSADADSGDKLTSSCWISFSDGHATIIGHFSKGILKCI